MIAKFCNLQNSTETVPRTQQNRTAIIYKDKRKSQYLGKFKLLIWSLTLHINFK